MAKIRSRGQKGLYKPVPTSELQSMNQKPKRGRLDKSLARLSKERKEELDKIKANPSLAIRSVKIIKKASDKK
jgi:hypothetical protein